MSIQTRFTKSSLNISDNSQSGLLDALELTSDELTQLQNIDSTTISTSQWGYLGGLDQALTTTDTVQFNRVEIQGFGHYIRYDNIIDGPAIYGNGGVRLGITGGETGIVDIKSTGIMPVTTTSYDIGSSSLEFNNIYLVNSPVVSSDIRYKKDISEMSADMSLLDNIKPINYKYNKTRKWYGKDNEVIKEEPINDTINRYGFSAGELKDALPENNSVIVEHPDGSLGIRPMELIPVMWCMIKDLRDEITKMKK